ncbi:hypothetical protein H5P28_13215 [Ruficoccus amylovorans]|uniref:Uncharacterized protein n=1 Tax=Ruficoccus amylovorans TaxID=1804625 RepID=A0A842HJ82_9BACT|nr:hypothetical protein [Ruficoccus amylovorans]MBC2595221.1 hypothetical protein [Ruficoccus amylovorans]
MKPINPLRKTFFHASALSLLMPVSALAISTTVWDGSDGNWGQEAQWSDGIPSAAKNVNIPAGKVQLNTYATARLFLIGCEAGKSASLVVEEGSTLQVGSAGASRLGAADGSTGVVTQNGGSVVIGNTFYVGGFQASGSSKATYTLKDGSLKVYRGDLVLGGNRTGSSESLFEQRGGEAELGGLSIGGERYLGMKESPVNQAEYAIYGGKLQVNGALSLGTEGTNGSGEASPVLSVHSGAVDVFVRGSLNFYDHKKSHPTLRYVLTDSKPGLIRVATKGDVSLGGALEINLPGGVAVLSSSELGLLQAGTGKLGGSFTTLPSAELWSLSTPTVGRDRSELRLSLAEKARVAEVTSSQPATFAPSKSGYAVLGNLTAGAAYEVTLTVAADGSANAADWAKSITRPGITAEAGAGGTVVIRGTADGETLYLVWDVSDIGISVVGVSL